MRSRGQQRGSCASPLLLVLPVQGVLGRGRGGGLGGSAYVLSVTEGASQHAARVEPYAGLRRKKSQVTSYKSTETLLYYEITEKPPQNKYKRSARVSCVYKVWNALSFCHNKSCFA